MEAVEQNEAKAQLKPDGMDVEGDGVTQSDAEAVQESIKEAQETRKIVEQPNKLADKVEAELPMDARLVKWFRLSAEQGNAKAQFLIGGWYHAGQWVKQDFVQAYVWYDLAALRSEGEDQKRAIKNRGKVAKDMTPEQIAEAQKLSREWKPNNSFLSPLQNRNNPHEIPFDVPPEWTPRK